MLKIIAKETTEIFKNLATLFDYLLGNSTKVAFLNTLVKFISYFLAGITTPWMLIVCFISSLVEISAPENKKEKSFNTTFANVQYSGHTAT